MHRNRPFIPVAWLTLLALLWSAIVAPGLAAPQTANDNLATAEKASQLLANLSPEEKVGQLFLVTFSGNVIAANANLIDLIANRYVGGVVIKASNGNIASNTFIQATNAAKNIATLNQQLQMLRWNSAQSTKTDPVSGQSFTPDFIPLFIGISQEGDGYPNDQILDQVTQLPNKMAIGATWNTSLSQQVGTILGKELAALGFNLLFGPSLDVLETHQTVGSNGLGTRTFGGDPFWVGSMGQAYIQGLHEGSAGKMAVIATHFPGHGGSDRLPEDEVATVRRSLAQLQSFELAPFFAVTGKATSELAMTEGLLVSHIRYQGLQGNIRSTTRPLSLDPQALSLLLELPELDSWRKNGGVIISDDLGSKAVRGFYSLTNQAFDMPRRVALNAFLAGNDLLYVADFTSGDLDAYTAAVRTLEFFAQKYREDTAFAQRVDASVLRILTLKYKLHQEFTLENVLPSADNLTEIGLSSKVPFDVARQAASLISPSQAELNDEIPDPPNANDRLVIISDTRTGRPCERCAERPLLTIRALEDVILRRYGPQAGGQVTTNNLISYSLEDLQKMLDTPRRNVTGDSDIERSLIRANWIVFAMLDASNAVPSYPTLNRFLTERPDLFQQKRLIVFAFGAPYYLDATNITKLSAFYCLYSKTPQFVNIAAYLLFQELRATGASPVSIPGTSYNINAVLFPDAERGFTLELDLPETSEANTGPTPTPFMPDFQIGDTIALRTGVILDHNGHAVPDGTPVNFIFNMSASQTNPASTLQQASTTIQGIARTIFTISRAGTLEVQAVSEPAQSQIFKFNIPFPPELELSPTITPAPITPTPTPTPTETPIPTAPPPQVVRPPMAPAAKTPALTDWIMAVLLAGGIAWVAYQLGSLMGQVRWGARAAFLALMGGLIAYSYLALQLPGSAQVLNASVARGVLLVTLGGACFGILSALIWRFLSETRLPTDKLNGPV